MGVNSKTTIPIIGTYIKYKSTGRNRRNTRWVIDGITIKFGTSLLVIPYWVLREKYFLSWWYFNNVKNTNTPSILEVSVFKVNLELGET